MTESPHPPRLYAIVDVEVCARTPWSAADLATLYFEGGSRLVQLRAKGLSGSEFLPLAQTITARAREFGARVIINDRPDIALLSGAAGVHVGQDDLPADAVRALVGPDRLLGVSTHTRQQLEAAVPAPVDYIAVGPVFATVTKARTVAPVGIGFVREAAALAAGRPIVAIGGITLETAVEVIEAGAVSVAVIADLLTGGDPKARVGEYIRALAGRA